MGGQGGGTGGGGGIGGSGGAPEIVPLDNACIADVAFQSAGLFFKSPTPQALALALNELTYDADTHPITVVLQGADPSNVSVAASATEEDSSISEVFLPGLTPTFAAGVLYEGGFQTDSPQSTGYVHIVDLASTVDIELSDLNIFATTSGDCTAAVIVIDAKIPAAERSKSITLASGTTTIGTLAGGSSTDDIQFGMLFQAISVGFDFSTL